MIGAPGAGPDLGARRAQPADLADGDVAGDDQRPVAGILASRRGGAVNAVPATAGPPGQVDRSVGDVGRVLRAAGCAADEAGCGARPASRSTGQSGKSVIGRIYNEVV